MFNAELRNACASTVGMDGLLRNKVHQQMYCKKINFAELSLLCVIHTYSGLDLQFQSRFFGILLEVTCDASGTIAGNLNEALSYVTQEIQINGIITRNVRDENII